MRPTRATVDLSRIAHNVRALRSCTRGPTRQMAVVKAHGYGHGAVPVARAALAAGATWLGVATVEEGAELREAGIDSPVLVLGAVPPEDAARAVGLDLTAALFSRDLASALDAAGRAAGHPAEAHLKVDTGMGRVGLAPAEAAAFLEWAQGLPGLQVSGIFSHFATADEADLAYAHRQLGTFADVLRTLQQRSRCPPLRHMANTAATMVLPDSHFDLVRTGIGIYGLYPSPQVPRTPELRPAMAFVTAVCHLKEVPAGTPISYGCTFVTRRPSRIATLPVGYGDGYPRLLSNRGQVLVAGRRAPLVGRVCMDMVLADVTDIPEAALGSPVVLFGEQGGQTIRADEIAELTGTINYEVTCNVGARVPRQYR